MRKLFNILVEDDEKEYILRRGMAFGLSGSAFARRKIFPQNWKRELSRLRKVQGSMDLLVKPGPKTNGIFKAEN